jgi:hypothetical protein
MQGLLKQLGFHGDPFEHLSAEQEKDIDKYAVRPPYFEQTFAKAKNTKSFVLFGHRGSGKSATRVTAFNSLWNDHQRGNKVPLTVNLIEFDSIIKEGLGKVSLRKFVDEACFKTIEAIFTWLAAINEEERTLYTEGFRDDERQLILNMVKSFYLNRVERTRTMSAEGALKLLDQAWHDRAAFWIEKRWSSIAKLIASLANGFGKEQFGTNGDQTDSLFELLYSHDNSDEQSAITVLSRLVEMVRIFNFSGVVLLVDKIDETDKTSSSVENSANLIFPLLSNVRIFEIDGLAWLLFVWDQIQPKLQQPERGIRLDKIPNAKVDWKTQELANLLQLRLNYFSNNAHQFETISDLTDPNTTMLEMIKLTTLSPRELIRLMDIIIREHNLNFQEGATIDLLTESAIGYGMNLYSKEAADFRYGEQFVKQLARIGKNIFINKDVQAVFKIGDQAARSKIQKWMDAGAVKHSGVRSSEDGGPGRGFNEYTIVDPRIARIMNEKLIQTEELLQEDDEQEEFVGTHE